MDINVHANILIYFADIYPKILPLIAMISFWRKDIRLFLTSQNVNFLCKINNFLLNCNRAGRFFFEIVKILS